MASYSSKVWTNGEGQTNARLNDDSMNDLEARVAAGFADAQPVDSDLTAIAALTTTSYGRAFLALADAAAARTALGNESWILVGSGGAAAAFANSWVNFDATAATSDAAYKKDAAGTVHIKGFVKNGSAVNSIVFQLPAGYRPSETLYVPITCGSGTPRWAFMSIGTTGDVTIQAGSATTAQGYVLDGTSFRPE